MGFIYSAKDAFRASVEAQSGGKNTVIYDDKGYPSIMVVIPMFYLDEVIDGAPHEPHPAFKVNGEIKDAIYISKYQNIVHDGRAYSLPSQDPKVYTTFDQALDYCKAKGAGWHLMTNAEWAAIALWCKKNGTMPRGNNNYGKDTVAAHEKGVPTYKYTSGETEYVGRVATGSGPASWAHDFTNEGIFDMNGNVHEWVHGLRLINGKIWVIAENDFDVQNEAGDTTGWYDTGVYIDNTDVGNDLQESNDISGSLFLSDSRLNPMYTGGDVDDHYGYNYHSFETLTVKDGFAVPDILKWHGLNPIDADLGEDRLYVRNYGERLPLRGGYWSDGSGAGVFALYLNYRTFFSYSYVGFRSAFCVL